MTTIFEQYEQAEAISAGFISGKPMIPEMTTAGLINAKFEDDGPLFQKQKLNFRGTVFGSNVCITHLAVSNHQLAIVMNSKVRRVDLNHPDDYDDVDLQKYLGDKSKIHSIFLDLSGKHLLMSLVHYENQGPYENLYLHQSSRKIIHASKTKGHVISSVGWNFQNNAENSTGFILIGTTKGLIFETELVSSDDRHFFQSNPESYWKQLYDVGINSVNANELRSITSLVFHKVSYDCYVVLATTPSRLFQFIGNSSSNDSPVLSSIFSSYKDLPEGFIELPGKLPQSKLQLFYSSAKDLPKSFAWMTEPGILYGNISCAVKPPESSVISNQKLISYPDGKNKSENPVSIILTEFHVLVLFQDSLKVLSVLNEQLVYEDVFSKMQKPLIGIIKDPVKGIIWAFSEIAIYQYKVFREDRNVWEIYLENGEYELAKQHCNKDPVKLDKVLSRQAEDYFQKGLYENSAIMYAVTHNSFEEIALKFLQAEQEKALKVFLMKKLEGLKPQDKTQITMLVLWLMEIFLNELGTLRNSGRQHTDQYLSLQSDFKTFLNFSRVQDCASENLGAVYNLMTSHGDEENVLYFAVLMKDYERVIQYHIQHKNYVTALEMLSKQSRSQLFYQFSPALMRAVPQKTVDTWIAQDHRLKPEKLIPALVQYDHTLDPKQGSEAIRYLEYCVYQMKSTDQAIHNYLLALYARLQPDNLMTYLVAQGQNSDSVSYDQKYALRLCSELGLDRACIHIYTTMGLYEEAVDLALKVDVELGKQNADRPEDNEELKKKLWLKIAKHVVKEKNDIKRAMEFLQECDLIKIEDILPFFPDFVTIDHFKDAICSSLQEYNQHIESLKEEMEEATESAQEIRTEIQTFRNKYSIVKSDQKCSACSYPIMMRSFYLFPCQHMFHSDCIIEEVLPHLPPKKKDRVKDIQRQLVALSGRDDAVSISSVSVLSSAMSKKDKLCAELDDLVASECLYCGDIMIRSIDVPFIPMDQYAAEMKSWE